MNSKTIGSDVLRPELDSKRRAVILDLKKSNHYLKNYTFQLSVHHMQPTYGELTFTGQRLKAFDRLKAYTGPYGFVVPVQSGSGKKILKGEKTFKYKDL